MPRLQPPRPPSTLPAYRAAVGERSPAGSLPVLRGAPQQPSTQRVLPGVVVALVASASAPQPETPAPVETLLPESWSMVAPAANHPSLSRPTPARHYLRQEPGAVVLHAGICAGAARQRAVLPQPRARCHVAPSPPGWYNPCEMLLVQHLRRPLATTKRAGAVLGGTLNDRREKACRMSGTNLPDVFSPRH